MTGKQPLTHGMLGRWLICQFRAEPRSKEELLTAKAQPAEPVKHE